MCRALEGLGVMSQSMTRFAGFHDARRWYDGRVTASRPIVGHALQRKALLRDIEQGNVAHAYLFAGPANIGKTMIARWFGTELLKAASPEADHEDIEHRAAHLLHPDLLVLDQLWIEEKSEDWDEIARSSNVSQRHRAKAPVMRTDVIGIDDVRGIQERLHETGETQRRVCVIRSAERMRDEAANAFLKIMEEPPPGRVLILTTESLSSLLPTLISRSRVLEFHPVPPAEMLPLLAGLSPDDARFTAHVSQGAPGRALAMAADPDTLREEKTVHGQAVRFWGKVTASQRMQLLSPLHEKGPEAERFLVHLSLALREAGGSEPRRTAALMDLVRALDTNASRQLIAQRFALDIDEMK